MKEAVREYAWRNRTRPSPVLAEMIQHITDNPDYYRGAEVPPAGNNYISVYITDEKWFKAKEAASSVGATLSAMVRVAISELLAAEDIPWDVTTSRTTTPIIPEKE